MKILKDRIHAHRGKKKGKLIGEILQILYAINKSLLETIQCTTLLCEIKLLIDFIGDICQISLVCIDERDLK